jgi:2-polyprenyl-6-hydroxyphenyl methylase/3-demethylubiquinone-9 3-methyltransferase
MEQAGADSINNRVYDHLGDRWYYARNDPIALLRAEARHRNPWIAERLRERSPSQQRILDIGCGAGFLSNYLAREGFNVVGLDVSAASLEVARKFDPTNGVNYELGNALELPYPDRSFDAVCAMDLLEHVERPTRVISEAARVLRPNGFFFFHTFNRNWLAWLVVIKGVEWFVENTPPNLHRLELFLKPGELRRMCADAGLGVVVVRGSGPVLSAAFFRMLTTRLVPDDFCFSFKRSTLLGYTGYATRQ